MDVSIQAVSPELICELRTIEGSVVEAGGGEVAGAVAAEAAGAGVHSLGSPAGAVAASGVEIGAATAGALLSLGAGL